MVRPRQVLSLKPEFRRKGQSTIGMDANGGPHELDCCGKYVKLIEASRVARR